MNDYSWRQFEPLSEEDKAVDLAAIRPLYESWRSAKQKLQESSLNNLTSFTDRLTRSLSIETGILEQLYDLDRGTTQALIAQGFAEDLVSRSSTDIEPSRLIDLLRDQEAAVQLVMDCVAQNRPLTKGFIHELHSILTAHQDTTTAIDQFGTRVEIPLVKGQFKAQPNNPQRPNGTFHEYCPPVHVDSEMDRLVDLLASYEGEDPIIVSSWLHHRFTQIHPYQDGNGRVARVLVTLVLLRADLLPLVVDRDLRVEYIKALESADFGDLTPLSMLFARLERGAILQALSIDTDAETERDRTLTSAVINSLAAKFSRRKELKDQELRTVNELAADLRMRTRRVLAQTLSSLKDPISLIGEPEIHMIEGGPDRKNAHWYKYDVIESGKSSGKFVNFAEDHYFIRGTLKVGAERLVFVTSFHHVGRELSGIMEVTSFARLESFEDANDREVASHDLFACALEPFVITWKTKEGDIASAYDKWLDASIAVAIKEFGDRL